MRKVIYSMTVSLDGFIAGPDGEIDWSPPDEELPALEGTGDADVAVIGGGFTGLWTALELLHRPLSAIGLGAALLVVNAAGAVAVIPVLTLTLAYSFLAAAHFVLPPEEAQ